MKELRVENLRVTVGDQEIVRGLSLRVPRGEVHALMAQTALGKALWPRFWPGIPITTSRAVRS